MKAAVLEGAHGVPHFGDFEEPQARDGQAVVEVAAAALNPVDVSRAAGDIPPPPPLPSVVGNEGVGRLPDGRRVYFAGPPAPYGSMAERTLVDPDNSFDVSDAVDDALAAALGIAGLTPWIALEWRARLQPGEHVLVLGATGTVGLVAVQAARLLGAARVVAAGRDGGGLERAARRGADATVALDGGADLAQAFSDAADGRIDVVIDPLGGELTLAALAAATKGARLVQIGHPAGARIDLALPSLRGRFLSILGHANGATPLELRRDAYGRILEHAAAGEIAIELERVPLRDVAGAWERQSAGTRSKLVLVP